MGVLSLEDLPHYTYEDYKHFEGNWELFYGVPYAMAPSPLVTHQSIASKIVIELSKAFQECKHCMVLSEIDYHVSNDTIVRPDVLMICKDIQEHVNKTPEIIFEVISKSTAKNDEHLKFELYQQEGVEYYVLVYPTSKIAKVYKLHQGKYIKVLNTTTENTDLTLSTCTTSFDFSKIWR